MVCSAGSVLVGGAAKFGGDQDHGVRPLRAEPRDQAIDRRVQNRVTPQMGLSRRGWLKTTLSRNPTPCGMNDTAGQPPGPEEGRNSDG